MSDDTFTDAGAGASAAAEAEAAASVKKSNPHSSAALLTTEILDILQGYSGSLGPLHRCDIFVKYSVRKMVRKFKPDENIHSVILSLSIVISTTLVRTFMCIDCLNALKVTECQMFNC